MTKAGAGKVDGGGCGEGVGEGTKTTPQDNLEEQVESEIRLTPQILQ
jgi:hypothetical protein